ncbi:MAG: hypothetical protein Q9160_001547 [Pyrenula sp. 1 TL-2023]
MIDDTTFPKPVDAVKGEIENCGAGGKEVLEKVLKVQSPRLPDRTSEVMADKESPKQQERPNHNDHSSRKSVSHSPPTAQIASIKNVAPSMNWNRGTNTAIRTSLRSNSNLPQSFNSNGVGVPSAERASEVSRSVSSTHTHSVRADNSVEVISVSDESSVEPAQDSRTIFVNLDNQQTTEMTNRNEPIEVSDDEEEDTAFTIDTKGVPLQDTSGEPVRVAAKSSLTDSESSNRQRILGDSSGNALVRSDVASQQGSSTKIADNPRKLSDLDQEELDDQFKYALFYLDRDCPRRKYNGHFAAWTLQDLDPTKIINLSLQKGTRKAGADDWGPKPELRIKGRARNQAPPEPDNFDDEEDSFFGPRVERQERSHIRFGDDRLDIKRLKINDGPRGGYDSYLPDNRVERFEHPPRGRRDDAYDRYYNPFQDDRRRSRSPVWDDRRAAAGARDDRFRHSIHSPPRGSGRTHPPTTRGGSSGGARRGNHQSKKRGFGKR